MSYFPLGEPPRDDVEAAAQLFIRYEDHGFVGEELGEMFILSVVDSDAVFARVEEIRDEQAAG